MFKALKEALFLLHVLQHSVIYGTPRDLLWGFAYFCHCCYYLIGGSYPVSNFEFEMSARYLPENIL